MAQRARSSTLWGLARTQRREPGGGSNVTGRAFLFGSPRHTSCVHVWSFTSRRQGRGLPKWQWPGESEAQSQRRRSYISGEDCRLGEPGCTLEKPGAAARVRCRRARAPRPPNPRAPAKLREPGTGAPGFPASRARPSPTRPRAPRRHRAMLHLSDFSGPDALLSKPTEGCAHASPELPRLPARDAPTAAAYPGGKERVWDSKTPNAMRGDGRGARGVGGMSPSARYHSHPHQGHSSLCESPACARPGASVGVPPLQNRKCTRRSAGALRQESSGGEESQLQAPRHAL